MNDRTVFMVVPGPLHTRTGGYLYDRHIVDALRLDGWQVQVLELVEGFPFPSAAARASAAKTFAALPDGMPVVVDGLALGVLPEIAEAHARRLHLIALVHHPLALETGLDEATATALQMSEQASLSHVRRVLVPSPSTATALSDYAVPTEKIVIVRPGTTRAPLSTGSGEAALRLLCVATLSARKGHRLLIEALDPLRELPWTLHCVGSDAHDPNTAAAVRAEIDRRGLNDRVVLTGEADDAALAAHYQSADAFVLASWHEGYGMVFDEAIAHGLPIIATTGGAIADTVPSAASQLVAAGDAPALSAALERLIRDEKWRAHLAAGAHAARRQHRSWAQAATEFARALQLETT